MSHGTSSVVAKNSRSQCRAIVHPFLVGAKIGDGRLDLDDPDLSAGVQRNEVGASAGGKCEAR